MNLQQDRHEEPEINLTSLIDVVFLLLIFFMVSTTFEQQALLHVDLPSATTARADQTPETVEFIVTEDARLFIDDEELTDTRAAPVRPALPHQSRQPPVPARVERPAAKAPPGRVFGGLAPPRPQTFHGWG